jgi:XTP/dITP diphosphohydrolase
MKLLIATNNAGKLRELRALLDAPGLELVGLRDVPGAPGVEEDGATFEANASKKAATLARFSGLWTLADDSGLEVDALGGQPGVYSARYAGAGSTDDANNRKLLAALAGEPNRRARFRCVLALASPDGATRCVAGACEGVITPAPRGDSGFGYDPVFQPDGHARTFAELPVEVKNRISHRARALAEAKSAWGSLLASNPAGW